MHLMIVENINWRPAELQFSIHSLGLTYWTISSLNLPLSSSSNTSRELLPNSRLVVDEDDLINVDVVQKLNKIAMSC